MRGCILRTALQREHFDAAAFYAPLQREHTMRLPHRGCELSCLRRPSCLQLRVSLMRRLLHLKKMELVTPVTRLKRMELAPSHGKTGMPTPPDTTATTHGHCRRCNRCTEIVRHGHAHGMCSQMGWREPKLRLDSVTVLRPKCPPFFTWQLTGPLCPVCFFVAMASAPA